MSDPAGFAAPSLGDLVGGRYRLDELVGTGGMAQVWSATDTVLNRRVAVKILHPHLRSDPAFVERFRQEARSGAQLHHPSVVAVYDTVSAPEIEAIVMELVEGETLRARLDRVGALPASDVRHLGVELADALDAAHRAGLTHRDIKPANILLCPDGSLKLADFGIAKDGSSTDLTQDGTLVGTASYLAPEQLEGAVVDGRADEFAVGVVLYEALCGRPPVQRRHRDGAGGGPAPPATDSTGPAHRRRHASRLGGDPADARTATGGAVSDDGRDGRRPRPRVRDRGPATAGSPGARHQRAPRRRGRAAPRPPQLGRHDDPRHAHRRRPPRDRGARRLGREHPQRHGDHVRPRADRPGADLEGDAVRSRGFGHARGERRAGRSRLRRQPRHRVEHRAVPADATSARSRASG